MHRADEPPIGAQNYLNKYATNMQVIIEKTRNPHFYEKFLIQRIKKKSLSKNASFLDKFQFPRLLV